MKYTIQILQDGSFLLKHYLSNGWLAAEIMAPDELSLFRELAGLLDVTFKENHNPALPELKGR